MIRKYTHKILEAGAGNRCRKCHPHHSRRLHRRNVDAHGPGGAFDFGLLRARRIHAVLHGDIGARIDKLILEAVPNSCVGRSVRRDDYVHPVGAFSLISVTYAFKYRKGEREGVNQDQRRLVCQYYEHVGTTVNV